MWLVEAFLAHWIVYSLAIIVGLLLLSGIRYIPNTRVGLVEKRTSRKGSVTTGIIALHGQAGFQPALLRGGWPLFLSSGRSSSGLTPDH